MPVESSVDVAPPRAAIEISLGRRLAMMLLGYIPLLHVLLAAAPIVAMLEGTAPMWFGWGLLSLGIVYLLPPLAVWPVRLRARLTAGRYPIDSGAFLCWWYVAQWQILFNRLPMLEEILRLLPGAYSTWLRLWGAKVGKLVYWSPGVRISDRPLLAVGDRVVVGIDAKLYAHFLAKTPAGAGELFLSPIVLGDDCLVGGCTLLPAGVEVAPCEQTPAARPLAPFAHFQDGRSVRSIRFNQETTDA